MKFYKLSLVISLLLVEQTDGWKDWPKKLNEDNCIENKKGKA